jgi:hypothetical protein
MDAFTSTIIFLTGVGKLTRGQLAAWAKSSRTHVDQVIRGESKFAPAEMDCIIQKCFEHQISEITSRYLPKGMRLIDDEILTYKSNGQITDEVMSMQKRLADVIRAWESGQKTLDQDVIHELHQLVDCIEQEFVGSKR